MLGFDALGRLALGQASTSTTSALAISAATGAFTLTGVAATLTSARIIAAIQGVYLLTGIAATLSKTKFLIADAGSYAVTGVALIVAHLVAPAHKLKIRLARFVLQKTRSTAPRLTK